MMSDIISLNLEAFLDAVERFSHAWIIFFCISQNFCEDVREKKRPNSLLNIFSVRNLQSKFIQ